MIDKVKPPKSWLRCKIKSPPFLAEARVFLLHECGFAIKVSGCVLKDFGVHFQEKGPSIVIDSSKKTTAKIGK